MFRDGLYYALTLIHSGTTSISNMLTFIQRLENNKPALRSERKLLAQFASQCCANLIGGHTHCEKQILLRIIYLRWVKAGGALIRHSGCTACSARIVFHLKSTTTFTQFQHVYRSVINNHQINMTSKHGRCRQRLLVSWAECSCQRQSNKNKTAMWRNQFSVLISTWIHTHSEPVERIISFQLFTL